jgi:hypothetical protein
VALAEALARQLRQPSGVVGRAMGHILNRANRPINERAVERLDVGPNDAVLEIGFGGGVATARVLARTQGFVAGIEISDVLKPGGRLLVATATKEEMERRSFTRHGFRKFEDEELGALLRDAGFAAVAVERDGVRVFTTGERR